MEDEFWYETYRVSTLWKHEMHKCITLQWHQLIKSDLNNAGVSTPFNSPVLFAMGNISS